MIKFYKENKHLFWLVLSVSIGKVWINNKDGDFMTSLIAGVFVTSLSICIDAYIEKYSKSNKIEDDFTS